MGSRKGPSAHKILGSRKDATRNQAQLQRKLKGNSAKDVAEAAFKAAAKANPIIEALYVVYKVAELTHPIVKKGVEEYQKTGDKDKAVDKMKEETLRQSGKKIKEAVVETIVGTTTDTVKDAAGIVTGKTTDTFVKAAVSKAINEVIK